MEQNNIHPGDSGFTSDFAGNKYSKDSCLIESLGNLDELIAYLGLVRFICQQDADFILKIQQQLKTFASLIASYPDSNSYLDVTELDHKIESISKNIPPIKNFFLPGEKEIPTFINIARTICRRTERSIVNSHPKELKIIKFTNRLSDYLFYLQMYYHLKK